MPGSVCASAHATLFPGPGKPKASDKLKKVLSMRMAALQGFGDAAEKVPSAAEGAANDVGSIASSQAVGK